MSREPRPVSDSLAGTVIDSLEFARSGATLQRSIGFDAMPRLADLLVSTDGSLKLRVDGRRDAQGKSWLLLDIEGTPELRCQRCLGGVRHEVRIKSRLQLVGPGEEWPDEDLADDSADAIEAERELAVLSLVEEEVLLALPIAPRHEHCEAPSANAAGNGSSPFAALAALKKV
jgi:uncharacterized protein